VTQIQDKAKELELVMKNVPETNAKIVTKVEDDLNRVLPILFDGLTPQNLKDPNEVQRKAIIPLLQQSIANQRTPLLRELLTKELGQNGVDPNSDKAKPTRQQGSHEGESPKNTPKK
jgi:hypothetical protein